MASSSTFSSSGPLTDNQQVATTSEDPSSSTTITSKAKAKAKAKAKSKDATIPSRTVPPHVLDHLLDLLVACGDLPPSFHTTAAADPALVTEAYLVAKLKATLDARGHVPFHQLVQLLQVSQQTADHVLDLVLTEPHSSALLVDAFLMTRQGYAALEQQLIDLVHARGTASADTLATATGTSTAVVYLMLDKPHLTSPDLRDNDMNASVVHRDAIDTSVYYSSAFQASLKAQLASALSSATEPVDLKPLLASTACPAGLWQSTLHALHPTLDGRLTGTLYTPTAYVTGQLDAARSLLATAGFLPLATTPPAVLSHLVSGDAPPWQLASVLVSAAHAKALADTIQALAEEATGPSLDDLVVDVTGQAPSVADAADARAFVARAFPTNPAGPATYLTAGSKVAHVPRLLRACLARVLHPTVSDILADVPAGTAPAGAAAASVTRAMLAAPLAGLPAAIRDALLPALVARVQTAVDAALVHRADAPLALRYWVARLSVYAADLARLRMPKPRVKMLDRAVLRHVGPPLRDALVAVLPEALGEEGDRVVQMVALAVETKSCAVVAKVVDTVATAHGVRLPSADEVRAERRVVCDEIVKVAEDLRGSGLPGSGKVNKRRGPAASHLATAEQRAHDDAQLDWWKVAERLVREKDLAVWLDPTVPEDLIRELVDKCLDSAPTN